MTILDRIRQIMSDNCEAQNITDDSTPASLEKMVWVTYWVAYEAATRRTSDVYSKHIAEQKQRANSCRYTHMANRIVGPQDYIYLSDYSGDITATFGGDPADI